MSTPDHRVNPPTVIGQRRLRQIRRAIFRALAGGGVVRFTQQGDAGWDFVDLPFNGRIKVTSARTVESQRAVLAWVKRHEERRHWGAAVTFNRFIDSGFTVHIPLEDFAMLLGHLEAHERTRREQ